MQQQEPVSSLTQGFDKIFVLPWKRIFGASLKEIPAFILSLCSFYGALYTSMRWVESYPYLPMLLMILSLIFKRLVIVANDRKTSIGLVANSLNSINYGLFFLIAFQYFSTSQWLFFVIVILLAYAVSAFYNYDRFKSNTYLALNISSSDIAIVFIVLILISRYAAARDFMQKPLIGIFNMVDVVNIFMGFVLFVYLIRLIRKVPHLTYGIWLFIGSFLAISAFGYQYFTPFQLTVLLALYGGWYVSKLNVAILVDGVERSTGFFTPIMVVVSYFMESLSMTNTFIIITVYMLFNIAVLLVKSIKTLKSA